MKNNVVFRTKNSSKIQHSLDSLYSRIYPTKVILIIDTRSRANAFRVRVS